MQIMKKPDFTERLGRDDIMISGIKMKRRMPSDLLRPAGEFAEYMCDTPDRLSRLMTRTNL